MRQWNEKQIEELLSKMPKLEDPRSMNEIYRYVIMDMEKKERKSWIIPSLASISVALILAVFSIPLFQVGEEGISRNAGQEKRGIQQRADMAANETKKTESSEDIDVEPSLMQSETVQYVTVAVPDQNAQFVVPLTYVIKDQKAALVQSVKEVAASIDEEKLGLSENIIQNLTFLEKENRVQVQVTENHLQGSGSAAEIMFLKSLEETFRWLPYEQLDFYTNGHPGILLGNTGNVTFLPLHPTLKKAYLIYQLDKEHPKLLVPTGDSYETIEEAIGVMKVNNAQLLASVPKTVGIAKVISESSHLTVIFTEETQLKNNEQYLYMIHALMLTARDFGYRSIAFKGGQLKAIGDVILEKRNRVPLAPNVVTVEDDNK